MNIEIYPSDSHCGATIRGLDLRNDLNKSQISTLRQAWMKYRLLSFPKQTLTPQALERFTLYFGDFGTDPFIQPIDGHEHVIAIKRAANETAPIFAEAWHTDWSFQQTPPAGTCLYGMIIPPQGGDTLFINQHEVLRHMPIELRARLEGLRAIHSARLAYHPDGEYGNKSSDRTMNIRASTSAAETQVHQLIRSHPETGEATIFGTAGYIIGFEGLSEEASRKLLMELYEWQTQERFQYRHKWEKGALLMWDNRSLLHMATGGYDGHARYLHRTTIADKDRSQSFRL